MYLSGYLFTGVGEHPLMMGYTHKLSKYPSNAGRANKVYNIKIYIEKFDKNIYLNISELLLYSQ